MGTSHLSDYELQARVSDRKTALDQAINLLIKQCRVAFTDPDAIIDLAQKVTSAAMALQQCEGAIDRREHVPKPPAPKPGYRD